MNVPKEKTGQKHAEAIMLKSLIWLKLGTNAWYHELTNALE